jgi:RHS repeat-associated protein
VKPNANNQPVILQYDSYYPFGLEMGGMSFVSSSENKYKYNGKEKQTAHNLGWYDYGFRFYDPQIGRWHVVDPLGEKYASMSTYNYCINNPILFVDPDGREIRIANKPGSNEQVAIFNNLQALTSDKLSYNSETGFVSIESKGNSEKSYGTELLNCLINGVKADGSSVMVTIQATTEPNTTQEENAADGRNPNKGTNSKVNFNPNDRDGGVNTSGEKDREPYIGLGHELIHTMIFAEGRHEDISTSINDPDQPREALPKQLSKNEVEVRTGENKLRKENNQLLRIIPQ